ncbi:MAG: 4Fe-4S dicluster domain-containing protein [Nitrospirae bacterium]|nr:MAG: 4Fe-4S dicluster domain-containing protein [Nitrospirota bacterium]
MSIDRREFLKKMGIGTLLGLGCLELDLFEVFKGEPEASTISNVSLKAKRWGMVIDMDKFGSEADYKKCIEACNRAHNIPVMENKKHEIKWIWTETYEHAFPSKHDKYISERLRDKPFLLLCNHCDNPPCVRVCPTQATFKRPDGIVMMDMHRCIGCRFCMAACPFGARSFNFVKPRPFIKEENPDYPTRTKGVVEKCTFCTERLARGLKPACVEASNGAIVFGDLNDPNSEIREILRREYTIRRKPELGTMPSVYYVIR